MTCSGYTTKIISRKYAFKPDNKNLTQRKFPALRYCHTLYTYLFPLQFGGKLVSFGNTRGPNTPKVVALSQVVTQHELVQRSHNLEESLAQHQLGEFCENKSQDCSSEYDKNLWNFLKVQCTLDFSLKSICVLTWSSKVKWLIDSLIF